MQKEIAIDYTFARNRIGGMGVFVRNLTQSLKKYDKKNKYITLVNPVKFNDKNIFTKLISAAKSQLWYQFQFGKELQKMGANTLYSPNPPIPLFLKTPAILTIPDMSFRFDDSINILTKYYLLLTYFVSAHKSFVITTFSKHSKNDISRILKIKIEKIKVIPLAPSDEFIKLSKKAKTKYVFGKFNINKPYILCTPGTFIPRKNVLDLLIAFSNLPKKIRSSYCVVLTGKQTGSQFKKIQKFTSDNKLTKTIIFTGPVKTKTLVELYKNADIFAHPSLYEGFGLTPLEAMLCGIPTIVYKNSSLPEVVVDASIFVDNSKGLANAIVKLHTDTKIRRKLIKRGYKVSSSYSWESVAGEYIRISSGL
ncbi:glycosyltransferase family 4 protein [Patescibacteria group bacterium]